MLAYALALEGLTIASRSRGSGPSLDVPPLQHSCPLRGPVRSILRSASATRLTAQAVTNDPSPLATSTFLAAGTARSRPLVDAEEPG